MRRRCGSTTTVGRSTMAGLLPSAEGDPHLHAGLRMLVDLAIGVDHLVEGHDRLDDLAAGPMPGNKQLPRGIGQAPVVPARMVTVWLALRPCKDEGRPVEVSFVPQVQ